MDPNALLHELLTLLAGKVERDTPAQLCVDLAVWLEKGGFHPAVMKANTVRVGETEWTTFLVARRA